MKMREKINNYNKYFVYEQYTRITENYKEYDKITRTKMLDEIYRVYSNYQNIIEICTARELKFLKLVLDNKLPMDSLTEITDLVELIRFNNKYSWEIKTLKNKFLIASNSSDGICIPEEIIENVDKAIKKVQWKEQKKMDELNEILVSYCKIQGSCLMDVLISFANGVTNLNEKTLSYHLLKNKLFNYYVFVYFKDIEMLGDDIPYAVYQDYLEMLDELESQRKIYGLAGTKQIDLRTYKTIFYNDVDIKNPKIKKFIERLEKIPGGKDVLLGFIQEASLLNTDRESFKNRLRIFLRSEENLNEFFQLMEEAMDEMPSGALNGFTPNEAKEIKLRQKEIQIEKNQSYVKQSNASLSKKDCALFYKIYFGLLEFTNKKYKINPFIKLYKQKNIDPYEITDIVDTFWENKDTLVLEFCLANPYKFNKEELQLASEFKKGIRDLFIIAKYEKEYTAFMGRDKVYMAKGIHVNIDHIIPYKELPYPVTTTIIPFKDVLIYDSILIGVNMRVPEDFYEVVKQDYDKAIKYYHL